jgi:hypothetical protein
MCNCEACQRRNSEQSANYDWLKFLFLVLLCVCMAASIPCKVLYDNHTGYVNNKQIYTDTVKNCGKEVTIIAIEDGLSSGKYARHYYETIVEFPNEWRVSVNSNGLYPKVGEKYEVQFCDSSYGHPFVLKRRIK